MVSVKNWFEQSFGQHATRTIFYHPILSLLRPGTHEITFVFLCLFYFSCFSQIQEPETSPERILSVPGAFETNQPDFWTRTSIWYTLSFYSCSKTIFDIDFLDGHNFYKFSKFGTWKISRTTIEIKILKIYPSRAWWITSKLIVSKSQIWQAWTIWSRTSVHYWLFQTVRRYFY